jgi:hypothetical protein
MDTSLVGVLLIEMENAICMEERLLHITQAQKQKRVNYGRKWEAGSTVEGPERVSRKLDF